MNDFWTSHGFVSTPETTDTGSQDYFQPQQTFHPRPLQQHFFQAPTHPQIQLSHVHPHVLRTQRSTSSLSTWSTVTSSSDTQSSISDFEDDAASISTFPTSIAPQSLRSVRSHGSTGKTPSLSIDPKLFRPLENGENGGGDEMLETAIPRTARRAPAPAPRAPASEASSSSGSPPAKANGKDGKKKTSHARKQNADHIPRPRNAFILFRKHVVDAKLIPTSVEMRHQNVSIITAKMWSEAPPEQKAHFNELARIEKEEHLKKYPGYRYQPVYRRTNVIRRRVRKDEAEEEKCKNIAELLSKGKSGEQLEAEIKEKLANEKTKKKSQSRKKDNAAASELSKGALRALRAQARQRQHQASGDWSDVSRATSIDPDTRSISTRRSSVFTQQSQSPEPHALAYGLGQDQQSIGGSDGMAYTHPGFGDIPMESQQFTCPISTQGTYSQSPQSFPSESHQQFLYPQPDSQFHPSFPQHNQQDLAGEFCSHDTALPFSPSISQFTFSAFSSSSSHDVAMDANSFSFDMFGVSHASQQQDLQPPISARWDKGHLLPPSSDVPLEKLPFDDGMMMGDFEAALAQADEFVAW
ncbi:hypothetical protein I350_01655 [Cryptococcus amylolentus CBS 6273]|uniref:HMG box domain-containing protein n=1 Tax=Cryptococcus amylolentus CBS 6273 TaxID=1296118 RepID=A0A1E3KDT5_9TREE|nr:hypothetical protein I350_01655 [Cryptococcus amylolentus CBS 6273]